MGDGWRSTLLYALFSSTGRHEERRSTTNDANIAPIAYQVNVIFLGFPNIPFLHMSNVQMCSCENGTEVLGNCAFLLSFEWSGLV